MLTRTFGDICALICLYIGVSKVLSSSVREFQTQIEKPRGFSKSLGRKVMIQDRRGCWRKTVAVIVILLGLALAKIPFARADVDSHIGSLTPNPSLRGLVHGEASNFIIAAQATAAGIIRNSAGAPVLNNAAPLAKFLLASSTCSSNMFDLRSQLLAAGATI
jgi:hypothetical protein